tara:strand:+ start:3653 stop:4621 length:969 start_codon:yes stop_codon:yes gene_type:complete
MARILTGIQSTGVPHLGNILGAVLPAIKLAKKSKSDSYLFIADLHSLTQIKDGKSLIEHNFATAAAWLACGLDVNKTVFYKQSDVGEVTELAWHLSCFYPYQRLTLAHSFKDKQSQINTVNTGLFIYPMLMAADILLYDAEIVPVGKDQLQHLEITRDVAARFNNLMGETFVIPKPFLTDSRQQILGTNGEKMSKSKNNIINIFLPKEKLRKQIMSIQTDSTPLEKSKDPKKCTVFHLYSLLASENDSRDLKNKYLAGGMGYGEAKQLLYELLLKKFNKERDRFDYLYKNPQEVHSALTLGAKKASVLAKKVLERVRKASGY